MTHWVCFQAISSLSVIHVHQPASLSLYNSRLMEARRSLQSRTDAIHDLLLLRSRVNKTISILSGMQKFSTNYCHFKVTCANWCFLTTYFNIFAKFFLKFPLQGMEPGFVTSWSSVNNMNLQFRHLENSQNSLDLSNSNKQKQTQL